MSKQFLAVIAAVIIVFIGIFALTNKSGGSSNSNGKAGTLTHHVEGQGQDGILLQEYGDYECPYCGQYFPIVKQVEQEFDKQITFQFSNFPLVSIHQNAFAGARAAEAAALQGKFWQMHDALYESQSQWTSASDPSSLFDQLAQQLGLNVTQFKSDYASTQVNNLINADMAQGNKLGITGTPTFYLDGKQIQVGESVPAFEQVIKAEIAKKAGNTSTTSTPANTGTTAQTKK
ncbi:MAG TPA: thioredoxin domain-containing protein [Candidatus Saccharimonadales bacterium]|jgi:protein-disulfide isomerase|nr:thioredoxin domain-containing protein [Candidatus Saccharimonadales bacterium]